MVVVVEVGDVFTVAEVVTVTVAEVAAVAEVLTVVVFVKLVIMALDEVAAVI